MNSPAGNLRFSRSIIVIIIGFAVLGTCLLISQHRDFPDLHTILDTGVFLLSGLLAMLLWDMGTRIESPFPRAVATSFAAASLLELLHVLASVDWFGKLAAISASSYDLRPSTWPPSAYVLPIGIGLSVWLMHRQYQRPVTLGILLFALSAALIPLFHSLPRYTSGGFLGITRPTLVPVPLLWLLVGIACWRLRSLNRMLPALALMAMILVLAHIPIIFSRSPHDAPAMVSHLGSIAACAILLLLLMRMASVDMLERLRAEKQLADLNQELERRVMERTAELESATKSSREEVSGRRRAENALKESRQLLQAVIDHSTAIIHVKDLEGRYLLVNDRFAEVVQRSSEDIIGRTDRDIFPEERAAAFRSLDQRALASGVSVTEEETFPHADGPHTYITAKCPLRSNGGEPYAVFGISTDITDRKRAEEALQDSETKTRLIVDTALDAVINIDEDGAITGWNPQAETTFGWKVEEVTGKLLSDIIIPARYREAHRSGLRRYLESGEGPVLNNRIEVAAIRRDGHEIPIELSITPIRVGNRVTFSAFVRDITERRRAEKALRESEQRLRMVMDLVPHFIFAKDRDGRFLFVNRAVADTYNLTPEDLVGRHDKELLPDREQCEDFVSDDQEVIVSGQPKFIAAEKRTDLNGRTLVLQTTKIPFTLPDTLETAVLGVSVDITAQNLAEEKAAWLSSFPERNPNPIVELDPSDGVVHYINPAANQLIPNLRSEGIRHPFLAGIRDLVGELTSGKKTVLQREFEMGRRCFSQTINYIPETGRVRVYSTDITDRKEAMEALRESEERFRTMADSAPVLIWVSGPTKSCTWFNRRWLDFVGRTLEEELGDGWAENVHPDDLQNCIDRYSRAFEMREAFVMEYRLRRYDGEWRWMIDQGVPRFLSNQEFAGFIGSCTDITEMRHKEQKLHHQLSRLHLLHRITRAIAERQDLHSIFQVVIRSLEDSLGLDLCIACLYDPNSHVLTVAGVGVQSAPLATELAMSDEARIEIDQNGLSRCVAGSLVYEADIAESKFPFPSRLARAGLRALVAAPLLVESKVFGVIVAARKKENSFSSGECEFLRQLTEHVALAVNHAQLHGALQQAYDDLRQTQQTVMQQERLRALGQMASGIAHDINNAISPVSLYTESLLETEHSLSERGRGYLETIQHAIDDVAETVSRMREFYRQREPELITRQLVLNRLVEQVVELTRARWRDIAQKRGQMIELKLVLSDNLPPIAGVESELREALTNLIFNAVDAMPDGGTLTIRTKLSKSEARPREIPAFITVYLEVSDTGVGMDDDTRRRCLEPFFTTKGERGTGLGLAMVYGTIRRHGADLEIESESGKGTTMRIVFPAASSLTASNTPTTVATVEPLRRLRLLVVDDDPLLLKSLRDTLELDGHVVTTIDGGKAGIETFKEATNRGEIFAAVITDLGMPYVDGRKVASAIKGASSSTPVILLTGWGQRLAVEGDVPEHVDRILSKPPKLRELREALVQLCAPPVN